MIWDYFRIRKKGAIKELTVIIIAIVVLVLMTLAILVLFKGEGFKLGEFVKNLLRFGRG